MTNEEVLDNPLFAKSMKHRDIIMLIEVVLYHEMVLYDCILSL
jgi:hypothetical protein